MLNLKSTISSGFVAMAILVFFVVSIGSIIVAKAEIEVDTASSGGSGSLDSGKVITTNNKCESEIKDVSVKQLKGFLDFLETNFQNKSSTSSLLNLAFAKYRVMRRELFNTYKKYYPRQGASQIITGTEPAACLKIINDTLEDARILLRKHAVKTSGVKKSTVLIEKYKSINDLLGALHQQFVLLKGYLDTFASKLPCYVKKECIKI